MNLYRFVTLHIQDKSITIAIHRYNFEKGLKLCHQYLKDNTNIDNKEFLKFMRENKIEGFAIDLLNIYKEKKECLEKE